MAVTLFSTGCPKCNVLRQKLDAKGVQYDLSSDADKMIKLGFMAAPILEVDGNYMEFSEAIKWVNAQ